ncbi:hypothetical protein MSG28_014422, partial [Choristoneura fumiferana]
GYVNYAIVGSLKRTDDVEPWQVRRIRRIIKHPHFNPYTKHNDIALLETDPGGPLTILNHGIHCMYTVVGITSFGMNCGSVGVPGWYTKVSHYVPWIESIKARNNKSQGRGAWCMDMDSGPVGLSHTHNSTGNGTAGAMKDDTLSLIRNNESIQYRSMVMSGSNPTAHCKEIIVPDEVTAAGEISQRDDQLIEPECASLNANILANSVDQQPLMNLNKDEGEFE